ncbi:Aste57867_9107 [Aphanomyces stellatus]|uniref:Aste57867_9107 protein n=1 Tax=Aphanomyces stellatus TaxID=120398 RepID=A0A485KMD9_9STRA|nr:hypothetical protein As57867_009071 [Aphanomyces stellatus]VFT85991.1 Aste57867_9107 [Aphanomyces stellatus]
MTTSKAAFTAIIKAIKAKEPIDPTLIAQCDVTHERYEDIESGTLDECTLLHVAAYYGHLDATKLFAAYFDINVAVPCGFLVGLRPLEMASYKGHVSTVAYLIEAGADVNVHSPNGVAPLTVACQEGHFEIASLLVAAGADVHYLHGEQGSTAMLTSASNGRMKIVELLLPLVDINQANKEGVTALHRASSSGHVDVVEALLIATANVNQATVDGDTPLHTACRMGREDVVRVLLPVADANIPNKRGWTPLFVACEKERLNIIRLLSEVSDMNIPDCSGKTALHVAVEFGLEKVVAELVIATSMSIRDKDGRTALDIANAKNAPAIATIIQETMAIDEALGQLEANAWDWNHRFEHDMTILMLAARRGRIHVVEQAVARGVDINAYDKRERTALIFASLNGYIGAVEVLTANTHCNLNFCALGHEGRSKVPPIGYALMNKHYQVACRLISRGCDAYITTQGKLLLDVMAPYLTEDVALILLLKDLPIEILDGQVVERVGHRFSWATFLDPSLPVDAQVRVNTVRALTRHTIFDTAANSHDVYKALAYATDKHGRCILHATDAATRQVLKDLLFFCARYEIADGPPIHVSATAVVVNANDHGIFNQVFDMHANPNGELDMDGYFYCSVYLNIGPWTKICAIKRSDEFAMLDKKNRGAITKVDYLRFCDQRYGGKMKVAIKFMRNMDEYEREVSTRQGLDPKYVLGLLPSPTPQQFQEHLPRLKINGDISVAEYPHVLVMPSADRSLHDIFEKEFVSDNKIRQMMEEVAHGLQHIHSKGIVHGDMKMLNVLRVANRLQLIDMDAATEVGQLAGAKWSSGILPPEMFYFLNRNELKAYERYWHGVETKLWEKVQPKYNYVVKGYRSNLPFTTSTTLPFELEQATSAMDMWAFGCMLYHMYSGEELVQTDRNQDVTDNAIQMAASWTNKKLQRLIRGKVKNPLACDLIERLLVVDAEDRLTVDQVLDHPYFSVRQGSNGGASDMSQQLKEFQDRMTKHFDQVHQGVTTLNANVAIVKQDTHELKQVVKKVLTLNEELVQRIESTKKALMHGIYEAASVHVPTSFVILPYNIVAEREKDVSGAEEKTTTFFQQFADMISTFNQDMEPDTVVSRALSILSPGDPLFLYLIDEVTGTPVVPDQLGDVYPIQIDTRSKAYVDFMSTNLPLIQSGFEILKACNQMASFLSLPSMDDDIVDILDGMASAQSTSVALFNVVQASVEAGDERTAVERVRGAALRELEEFFTSKDPKRTFAGLERVHLSSGQAVWTSSKWAAQFEHGLDGRPMQHNLTLANYPCHDGTVKPRSVTNGGVKSFEVNKSAQIVDDWSNGQYGQVTNDYELGSSAVTAPVFDVPSVSSAPLPSDGSPMDGYDKALLVAAASGHVAHVRGLVHLANVNVVDADGNTALHLGLTHGYAEIVTLLVHTCRMDIRNKMGHTALDVASMHHAASTAVLQLHNSRLGFNVMSEVSQRQV